MRKAELNQNFIIYLQLLNDGKYEIVTPFIVRDSFRLDSLPAYEKCDMYFEYRGKLFYFEDISNLLLGNKVEYEIHYVTRRRYKARGFSDLNEREWCGEVELMMNNEIGEGVSRVSYLKSRKLYFHENRLRLLSVSKL